MKKISFLFAALIGLNFAYAGVDDDAVTEQVKDGFYQIEVVVGDTYGTKMLKSDSYDSSVKESFDLQIEPELHIDN